MHPKRDQNSKFSPWPWCGCPVGSDSHALKAVKNICEPNGSKNSKRKASILVAVKVFFFFPCFQITHLSSQPSACAGADGWFWGCAEDGSERKPVRSFPPFVAWGLYRKNVKDLLIEKG